MCSAVSGGMPGDDQPLLGHRDEDELWDAEHGSQQAATSMPHLLGQHPSSVIRHLQRKGVAKLGEFRVPVSRAPLDPLSRAAVLPNPPQAARASRCQLPPPSMRRTQQTHLSKRALAASPPAPTLLARTSWCWASWGTTASSPWAPTVCSSTTRQPGGRSWGSPPRDTPVGGGAAEQNTRGACCHAQTANARGSPLRLCCMEAPCGAAGWSSTIPVVAYCVTVKDAAAPDKHGLLQV